MVEKCQFRSDLYYRLNVFPVEVPPLRDRRSDIPELAKHFAKKYARRMNKRVDTIRTTDIEVLSDYRWPGNIRELQNVIERCVILSSAGVLHSPSGMLKRIGNSSPSGFRTLAQAEHDHIVQALSQTDWVVGGPDGAAQLLAVKRTTLLEKMRRLGISRPPG
jgi:formate hydrogenlyase transcriptional activator